MVADKTLGRTRVGVTDKRTDTGPSSKHIASANIDFWLKVTLNLLENPVNLFLASNGIPLDVTSGVCCTRNGVALPWQEEDDTTVRSVGIDETHVCRAVVARKDDVNTRARSDNFRHLLVVHFADGVGEGTGSIDDTLGLDRELFSLLAIALSDAILGLCSAQTTVSILLEAGDLEMVDDSCAV